MGLEQDVRAGATRVGQVAFSPDDLNPNVSRLIDSVRRGQIDANEILDRFSSKAIAEDQAATAKAKVAKQEAEQIGPLQIQAKAAMLTPEMIQLGARAQQGSLEEAIADQEIKKVTRADRNKYTAAVAAQAVNDITGGVRSEAARQLAELYPNIVKPRYDSLGVVINQDEVKSQIASVKAYQAWIDSQKDLADRIEKRELDFGTHKEVQMVWKGSGQPVPQETLRAITTAQQALPGQMLFKDPEISKKLVEMFGTPGQITPAAPQAQAPVATPTAATPATQPSVLPPAGQPVQVQVGGGGIPSKAPAVGTVGPGGGTVISTPLAGGKPTEVEGNALQFANRMDLAEQQYTKILNEGVDPTSWSLQTQRSLAGGALSKLPVVGPAIDMSVSKDAKRLQSVIAGFTSAMLREESGAAIRDDERAEYERTFFPTAGDPQDVIENKAALRASALASLRQIADRQMSPEAYENYISSITGKQFPYATSVKNPQSPTAKRAAGQPVGFSVEGTPQASIKTSTSTSKVPAKPIVDASGKPAPGSIPRVKPGDLPALRAAKAKGGWVWIEGEPNPRKFR